MASTIVAAMSGGVDSSVAAALLVEQGENVIGMTMKMWSPEQEPQAAHHPRVCCSLESSEDARQVAAKLGIPHYVINCSAEFQFTVVAEFCNEYLAGRTPNPCIRCNSDLKFGTLLQRAKAVGADRVATGHYARVGFDPQRERFVLRRAVDAAKDQSYVLYSLTQSQLAAAIFPLGAMTKRQVRALAAKLELKTASKPDSQEICFVPENDYRKFLADRFPNLIVPGPIVDTKGKVLGEHKGIAFYTVGQRKGLGISAPQALYVVALKPEENAVVVGTEATLFKRKFEVTRVNWVAFESPPAEFKANVKVRYLHAGAPATIFCGDRNVVRVVFDAPQRAVTPGQAAVFYEGDMVLGGGTIQ